MKSNVSFFDFPNILFICVVWIATLVIALNATPDILEKSAFARGLVAVVGLVLPVEAYGEKSAFPQLSRVVFALAWTAFPSLWILWRRYFRSRTGGILVQPRSTWRVSQVLALVFFIALFGALGYAAAFLMRGQDTRHVLFGSNPTHLGLFAVTMPCASAFFLAAAFSGIKKIITDKP